MKDLKGSLIQNTNSKFYGLDHLRALAITLVFFYHYQLGMFGHPEWLTDVFKFGWTGVDLFFVLSGFLIASQLFSKIKQGKRISFKEFFLRRFFRIIPAFWVVVAIYFCVPFFHERESLPLIWKFLTFTQNFGLNIKTSGTFSHAWSLCVEEHFYFFFPILLILLRYVNLFKNSIWLIVALFLLGFMVRNYNWAHFYLPVADQKSSWLSWYEYIYYPTYNRLDGLLTGVAIASLYQFRQGTWNKISKYGNVWIAVSLLVLSCAYILCYEEHSYAATVFGFPLVSFGYGLMIIGAICPTSFLFRWNSKITTLIASLSYGIYLTHKGLIHITQVIAGKLENINANGNLMMLICIISSIIGALLLNKAIEKPFMKIRNKVIENG